MHSNIVKGTWDVK